MQISEVSRRCNLSIDTIRYYEKCGLIPEVPRGANGHRVYGSLHVEWLTLIYWMRATDMPLAQVRRFAELARQGDESLEERRALLTAHRDTLLQKRALLDRCTEVLDVKISSYEKGNQQ